LKILREIEAEDAKKDWFPNFDLTSFGLGGAIGLAAGIAAAFAFSKSK
jgi:hypothetical protein